MEAAVEENAEELGAGRPRERVVMSIDLNADAPVLIVFSHKLVSNWKFYQSFIICYST